MKTGDRKRERERERERPVGTPVAIEYDQNNTA